MTLRTLAMIASAIVVVLGLAFALPQLGDGSLLGDTYLTDLEDQLDSVHEIEIREAGETLKFSLKDNAWVIASAANAPADSARVRQALLSLTRLRVEEEKTNDPKIYPDLGLTPASQRIRAMNAAGKVLADLWIGEPVDQSKNWVYARKEAASNAVTLRGWTPLEANAAKWTTLAMPSINMTRLTSIEIVEADGGRLLFARNSAGKLTNPGAHAEAGNEIARNFSRLNFTKLRAAREIDWTAARLLILKTSDGLEATAQVTRNDPVFWMRLNAVARTKTQGIVDEAARINNLRAFAFGVDQYVGDALLKGREGLALRGR
jgi:Domain of unknown function (DUF4340)